MTTETLPADLLERVVRAENVAWYDWTMDQERIRVSPAYAEVFDLDGGNVTTRTTYEFLHPDDLPAFRAAHVAFFKSRDTNLTVEYRFRQRGGAIRWARVRAMAERDAAGRVTRMTGTVADITEAKEQEAQNRAYAARQAASIEVLKTIAASPGDTQPVFELIARRARALCDADAVAISESDGALIHMRMFEGDDPVVTARALAAPPRPVATDTFHGRVLLTNETIHIPDHGLEPFDPVYRDLGAKSSLFVPLRRDGRAIGVLALSRMTQGGFDDSQIALVESFAEQASLAITGATTLRELRTRTAELAERNDAFAERIEHQAATIDVLKEMSSSPGDTQPVFDRIVNQAVRLCDGMFGVLVEYDGALVHLRAVEGTIPGSVEAYRGQFPMVPTRGTNICRAILERAVVQIRNLDTDPAVAEATRAIRHKSSVAVPLLRGDEVIGAIGLAAQDPGGFSDAQIELLKTFAEQAVIAIGSAETYRALQTRTSDLQESLEYQTATSDVLKVISRSTFDLRPVLDAVAETAARLCNAEQAAIARFDGGMSRFAANFGFPPAYEAAVKALGAIPYEPDSPNVSSRCILEGRPVHVLDAAAVPGYSRRSIELGKQRTSLGVPLLRDGEAIGSIVLARQHVEPFTDRQIELVRTFADQAVIAIENTRLLTEQREALEQQTATAEVLGVINASPGDLAPVFDAILEKAMRLCGSAFGFMSTWDGERVHPVASRGVPPAFATYEASRGSTAALPPVVRRVMETKRPVQVADIRDGEGYRNGHPDSRAVADLGGARSLLHLPLLKDETFVGYLTVYRQEQRPYGDKEVALLEAFAAQAVIAMENARLLGELRERTAELSARDADNQALIARQAASIEVLKAIAASPDDPQPVFELIVRRACELCNAQAGNLFDHDGTTMHVRFMHGFAPEAEARLRAVYPRSPGLDTLPGRVVLSGQRVHLPDAQADQGLIQQGRGLGARAFLGVPLLREGRVIGVLALARFDPGEYDQSAIELVQSFAAQAVIAMENARLLGELRESLEQQTATAEVLTAINASPGDLAPVFDTILAKAHALCGAELGSLGVFEDGMFRKVARYGYQGHADAVLSQAYSAGPEHAPLLRGEAIHIPDVMSHPWSDPERALAYFMSSGLRTWLEVPLWKDDTLVGTISGFRQQPRPFSDKEIRLLQSFAAQAVIAMENARLLNEIKQRQGELDVTFQSMGDGVALFDETHRLAAWNQNFQDMLDVPADIVAVRPAFTDYIRYLADRGEYGADPTDMVSRLLSQPGQRASFERTRPNGQVIQIRTNPTPAGGFVVMYTDITERKRAEEALRAARDAAENALRELKIAQANLVQAEKMASLGQLTAGIAHEIKNPLNFVNNFAALSVDLLAELNEAAAPGFATLTEDQRADIDDLSAMLTTNLQKITEHGKRADGIVKAMLEHSRGSSGERREVDLNALVDEALNLAYHGARAQDQSFNITLERDFGTGIAPIELNPQDMTRVFLNMFSNGFYAANKRAKEDTESGFEPVLKVSTRAVGDAVEIRIRDNGTGIPADIRDKLFQPFFTTKPTGEGTGLGLSITYDIVTKAHGGTIEVESEPGVFTEFVVTLPREMFGSEGARP